MRVFGTDSVQILAEAGFEVKVSRGADCPDGIRLVTGPADYVSSDIFFCWKDAADGENGRIDDVVLGESATNENCA